GTVGGRANRGALEEDWSEQVANFETSRLQINRLRVITSPLGTGWQSTLETRPEFLHRADAHRARGSAYCTGTLRRRAQSRDPHAYRKHFADLAARRREPREAACPIRDGRDQQS